MGGGSRDDLDGKLASVGFARELLGDFTDEMADGLTVDASAISTGVLPVARGGTGSTSLDGVRTSLVNYATEEEVDAYLSGETSDVALGLRPVSVAQLKRALETI